MTNQTICHTCGYPKRNGACPTPDECARLARPRWRSMTKTRDEERARRRVKEMDRA